MRVGPAKGAGEMAEWSNAHDSKSCIPERVSGVRISLSPPQLMIKTKATTIPAYNKSQAKADKVICDVLKMEIEAGLPKAESKIWHGHPVWFLDGNPIVGYHKMKDSVRIMFWSGQGFDEPGLASEGTFKAAEARYTSVSEVDVKALKRWLKKSKAIQWDYKNIVKRKGVLKKLK